MTSSNKKSDIYLLLNHFRPFLGWFLVKFILYCIMIIKHDHDTKSPDLDSMASKMRDKHQKVHHHHVHFLLVCINYLFIFLFFGWCEDEKRNVENWNEIGRWLMEEWKFLDSVGVSEMERGKHMMNVKEIRGKLATILTRFSFLLAVMRNIKAL